MSSRRIVVLVPMILLCIGLCLYFAACDGDGPVEPEEPKDYVVYFIDHHQHDGNWFFAYHPTSNKLDSFWLPYTSDPVVSADGKKMYVGDGDMMRIGIVDLNSLTVIDELPYELPIAVSPDNQLLAVRGEGVRILKTSDYSEVFHDTVIVWRGTFSSDSHRFYGATSEGQVYRIELSDTLVTVNAKSFANGGVRQVVPSWDESKWFLYLQVSSGLFRFDIYDVFGDSIVYTAWLSPGYGELELTPDGKYVFYTNPGRENTAAGSPWIGVHDVERRRIHTMITTAGILDPPNDYGIPVSDVCITPDGRWLVAVASGAFSGYPFLLTLDVRTMQFVKHIKFGGNRNFRGLTCQSRL